MKLNTPNPHYLNALLLVAIAVLSLSLAGCAGTPIVTTKTVDVPVMVTCVTSVPVKPEFPLQLSVGDEDLFILTKRALAEIELRKGYEGELEAVLMACKTPN